MTTTMMINPAFGQVSNHNNPATPLPTAPDAPAALTPSGGGVPARPSFAAMLRENRQAPPPPAPPRQTAAHAHDGNDAAAAAAGEVDRPHAEPKPKARSGDRTDKVDNKPRATAPAAPPAEAAAGSSGPRPVDETLPAATNATLAQWLAPPLPSPLPVPPAATLALDAAAATEAASAAAAAAGNGNGNGNGSLAASAPAETAGAQARLQRHGAGGDAEPPAGDKTGESFGSALLTEQQHAGKAAETPESGTLRSDGLPGGAMPLQASGAQPVRGPSPPPAMAAVQPPVGSAQFPEALGVQVSMLARAGVQHAELHLNPSDMGPVSVQIVIDGTQARVDFGADMAATREAIEAGLPELAGALRDAGFTLAGGGVSQHARERGDGAGGTGTGSNGDRTRAPDDDRGDERETAASERPLRRNLTAGGVDVFA